MLPVRIKQRHRHRRGAVVGHHLHQPALPQMIDHVIGRGLDETQAGEAAGDAAFGAVDADPARHRGRARLVRLDPLPVLNATS